MGFDKPESTAFATTQPLAASLGGAVRPGAIDNQSLVTLPRLYRVLLGQGSLRVIGCGTYGPGVAAPGFLPILGCAVWLIATTMPVLFLSAVRGNAVAQVRAAPEQNGETVNVCKLSSSTLLSLRSKTPSRVPRVCKALLRSSSPATSGVNGPCVPPSGGARGGA